MSAGLDIGVVGCGTAGAAAALFLARAGHRVTVYERVADPRPIGAGITLQPTGQAVLARLGLLAPILERGARLDRLWCRKRSGRTLVDLRYARIDPALFGLGLHRGLLFETMFTTCKHEPGVTVICGAAVEGFTHAGDAGSGRRHVVTAGGARHGPHDLIVVADGSVSELHDDCGDGIRVKSSLYPWGALWFVAEDRERVYRDELYQVVDGARCMLGFLPTGCTPRGATPVVSLFWSLNAARHEAWRAAGLAAWKETILRLDPRAAFVLDQIEDLDQVVFTRYRDVRMRPWHTRGLVFVGDAAHATSPQLGQGCNLALWDAMVLADRLAGAGDPAAVERGLQAYSRERTRHLGYYQFMTRLLTPLFQSDSRFLGWTRDALMPMAAWLPPFNRLMVRTMAGTKRGLWRRPLELPP